MRFVISFVLMVVVPFLFGCEQLRKDQPMVKERKTMEQIRQEKETLRRERQRQKEENLHNAMPHLLRIAQERGDFTNFSTLKNFDKNLEVFNMLQNNFLEELEEGVVDPDSIDMLRKLISERMKYEFPAMRKQVCRILLYSTTTKPNVSYEPTLSEIQCDGFAYDTLELISMDFVTREKMDFYIKRLEPLRFKQIKFLMKKNYRDYELFENRLADTVFIKN